MSNPPHRRRSRAAAVVLVALVAVALAACSSTTETDPTTTIQAMTGTAAPDDDTDPTDDPDTGGDPGTTAPSRTGTSLVEPTDVPTGDETEAEYADALVASFEGDPDEIFTQADVECIAPKWVAAIGVEAFQDAGITPAALANGDSGLDDVEIDRSTAEVIVDAIPECDLDLMELFLDGLPAAVKDDPDAVACIEGSVTADQVRDTLIDEISATSGGGAEDLIGPCVE